jgi:hypothetical protein
MRLGTNSLPPPLGSRQRNLQAAGNSAKSRCLDRRVSEWGSLCCSFVKPLENASGIASLIVTLIVLFGIPYCTRSTAGILWVRIRLVSEQIFHIWIEVFAPAPRVLPHIVPVSVSQNIRICPERKSFWCT